MPTITILEIADAITTHLAAATGIARSQSMDELTEDFNDLPLLQVYAQMGETDVTTDNSRTTFKSVRRTSEQTFHADVVCRQRSDIGADMAKVAEMQEAVQLKLEAEKTKPFFDEPRIMDFWWRWEILTFMKNDRPYLGVRFVISTRVG